LNKHAERLNKHAERLNKHAERLNKHAEWLSKHAEWLSKHAEWLSKHAERLSKHVERLRKNPPWFEEGLFGDCEKVISKNMVKHCPSLQIGIAVFKPEELIDELKFLNNTKMSGRRDWQPKKVPLFVGAYKFIHRCFGPGGKEIIIINHDIPFVDENFIQKV